MKFSINKLKGTKVYFFGKDEPWGIFSDAILDENGKVAAYIIKTLSLVPISKTVQKKDIDTIDNGKIVLKRGTRLVNSEFFRKAYIDNTINAEDVKTVVIADTKPQKLKDMQFEFETGEICDIVVSKNIIAGRRRLSVNKISAKDNTIYI